MAVVTEELCQQILKSNYDDTYQCDNFDLTPYNEAKIGFSGDHYKLKITAKTKDGRTEDFKYFLKVMPTVSRRHNEHVKVQKLFEKELNVYSLILPLFKSYLPELSEFAPQKVLTSENVMVFQDIEAAGFSMHNEYFDMNQWPAVLSTLAKLHAASIIHEQKREYARPTKLSEDYPAALKESAFLMDSRHPRGKWVRANLMAIIDLIHANTVYKRRMEVSDKLMKFVFNRLPKYLAPSTVYVNVINHGYLCRSNIFFKTQGVKCVDAVLVGYQYTRYAPPALDLLIALYLNSDKEYLDINYIALINMYHSYLDNYLKKEDLCLNDIIPIEEFSNTIDEYKMAAIVISVFLSIFLNIGEEFTQQLMKNEEMFDEFMYNNRSKYVLEQYNTDPNFRDKTDLLLKQLCRSILRYQF